MEQISNKRILIAIGFVMLLTIIVIIWYFFYAKPVIKNNITETNNPLPTQQLPPRFQFLNWGDDEQGTSTTEIIDPLLQPLIRIWDKPATGQAFITQSILKEVGGSSSDSSTTPKRTVRATTTVVIFVDRSTGYVYGFSLDSGKAFQISNTLIPGVHDAYIFDNGRKVLMRYFDQQKTKIATLIGNIPSVEENESPLPLTNIQYITQTVTSVATNMKRDRVSYVATSEGKSSFYTISSKGAGLVTTSLFNEWNLLYGGERLYATPKASAYVMGSTFSLPTFQPLVSNKTGLLSVVSDDGIILNSMWSTQGLATFISQNGSFTNLTAKTLASKCAWGEKTFLVCAVPTNFSRKVEGYPDDWYQGRVSFNDVLTVIDVTTGEDYPFYKFKEEEGVFDITNITISKNNTYIAFTKKQDASLWMINTTLIEDYGGN